MKMEKMMKSINLAVIVTSVMLMVSGFAQADSAHKNDATNHNFMSKRPYQAPLENKAYNAEDKWEGTTLRDETVEDSAAVKKNSTTLKQLRLNSLGRRPHME
jgi:hypothetical protein